MNYDSCTPTAAVFFRAAIEKWMRREVRKFLFRGPGRTGPSTAWNLCHVLQTASEVDVYS
jgi:hypothetical protein